MKTLNEQIERVRELVRKCYGAVFAKGGEVPEVGERNMENLPAAIGSIKSASEVPKVKVSSFTVTNNCINEEGRWEGDTLIDTSYVTSLSNIFDSCDLLKELDVSGWDVSNVTQMESTFRFCTSLKYIDVSNWDTSKVKSFTSMFSWSKNMDVKGLENFDTSSAITVNQMFVGGLATKVVDFTNWDFSNVTSASNFADGWKATSIVGGRTIEDVISNDVKVFKNLKVSTRYLWYTDNIDRASLRAIINGLADLTGQTTQTLTIGAPLLAKLTEEDIAIAVNKNWTLA